MLVSMRTNKFDASSDIEDGAFRGEDLAKWLQSRMPDWQSDVVEEDWGWAVVTRKGEYHYIFGVYDHDTTDQTEPGPKWVLRLYNQKDKTPWFKKLFKNVPPTAHTEVVDEVVAILKSEEGISEVTVSPLD